MQTHQPIGYRYIILSAVALAFFSACSLWIDAELPKHRHTELIPGDLRRIILLSEVFAHGFGIALAMVLIWKLSPERKKYLPRLAACAILPGLACQLVKLFVPRYRPGQYFPETVGNIFDTWLGLWSGGPLNFEYLTQSFPSAHAATAVGLCVGLCWLFPNARSIFISLAFMASLQRVVAGAHWLSDVFAGAAISIVICNVVFRDRFLNACFKRFESPAATTETFRIEDEVIPAASPDRHKSPSKAA